MEVTAVEWAVTIGVVVALIAFDLFKHRKPHAPTMREAGISTLVWTLIGVAFAGVVFAFNDATTAGEYLTGYVLERTLSLDNVFVFVLILSYFAVPPKVQHQALMFGIIVALVLRAVFIFVGAGLLEAFDWMVYVFGGFLVYTAIRLALSGDDEVDPDKNVALKALRKVVPVTANYEGAKLITHLPNAKRAVTPLLAVLLVIGTTDVVFAVDSIPAIFAALREPEPYLVFSANAFALLGLLPMTFLIAGSVERFKYLKHALALVLGLVGAKMIVDGLFHWHPNTFVFLAVVVGILVGGVAYSLYKTRHEPRHDPLHTSS